MCVVMYNVILTSFLSKNSGFKVNIGAIQFFKLSIKRPILYFDLNSHF